MRNKIRSACGHEFFKIFISVLCFCILTMGLVSLSPAQDHQMLYNKIIICVTANNIYYSSYHYDETGANVKVKDGVFQVTYRNGRSHLVSGACVVKDVSEQK